MVDNRHESLNARGDGGPSGGRPPGWDSFMLAILIFAHLQISGLAEAAALPNRVQDVARHPFLGSILPASGMTAMGEIGPRPGDPIGLVLNAITLGLLLLYFVADLALTSRTRTRAKWALLITIIVTALILPTTKLTLLRQGSGPASYAHDGGVIQTESTIEFVLDGKNPYTEDYVETPMAEWGFSEYRTAIYHYPYLPWTFLFSLPFQILSNAVAFYDQRFVYLLLIAVALALAPRLLQGSRVRLALVAILALNPIMALDILFGQNDVFVLAWIILSLVSWHLWLESTQGGARGRRLLLWTSVILFGLACASKPTAWFFAPFYGFLLIADRAPASGEGWIGLLRAVPPILARAWPAIVVFFVIAGPYIAWDPWSFYDDVWRWSSGQGETGYQIWGWGGSNFVLALGLVGDRFGQWPFWLTEILIALPILLWFLRRQQAHNTLANACWHYAVFLMAFFYASRFLNENYLGFILAFLAIGIMSVVDSGASPQSPQHG